MTSHAPIQILGDAALIAYFQGNSSNGSALNPFIIDGFLVDASSAVHGIEIQDTTLHVLIRNNTIRNARNPAHSSQLPSGIMLKNVTGVSIQDNTIEQNYLGISVTQSSSIVVTSNALVNNSLIGVGLNFSAYITLRNNDFFNCGLHVLGTLEDCVSLQIDDSNTINGGGRLYYFTSLKGTSIHALPHGSEVFLINCTDVTVSGLDTSFSSVGIMVLYSTRCIIQDNMITDQNYHCIVIAGSRDCTIRRNVLAGSYYALGALLCEGCRFEENVVTGAIFDGMVILSCNNTVVVKNSFRGNTEYGIKVVTSTSVEIRGNEVRESEMGIASAWDNDHVDISKNSIINCSQYGIVVDFSSNVTIRSNTVQYCDHALRIYQIAGDAMVYLNNFLNSTSGHVDLLMLSTVSWNTTMWGNYWDDHASIIPGSQQTERGTWVMPYILGTGEVNVTDNHALVSPNRLPNASATIMGNRITSGKPCTIVFTGDVGDAPAIITCYFGDGTSATMNQQQVLHVFQSAGEYTVTIVITDKHGEQDVVLLVVIVDRDPLVDGLPLLISISLAVVASMILVVRIKKRGSPGPRS
ncbi:MAG: hypothetical protein GYA24_25625 [Candidatus Lokiarchaeota archaeon]|nr:hypothetical protein [Candidatus Lokiarchaeota archaeon]